MLAVESCLWMKGEVSEFEMVILHASWSNGTPVFWTERKIPEGEFPVQVPGRLPVHPGPLLLDGREEGLRQAVAAAGLRFPSELLQRAFIDREVWLPTRGKLPIPSNPTLYPGEVGKGKLRLVPWEVRGLPVHVTFLTELMDFTSREDFPVKGVLPGKELFWFSSLSSLALALVMRQRYLPSLVAGKKGFCPLWEPWLEEPERERLTALAKCMPGVVRCMHLPGEKRAPVTSPYQLVLEIVTGVVDALVREAVPEPDHRTEREFDSIDEAWMSFLRAGREGRELTPSRPVVEFLSRLDRWKRPLQLASTSMYRLCFRLEEPEEEENLWTIRLLVQSRRDPSLFLPIEATWEERTLLDGEAMEYLLLAIGQASELCPGLKQKASTIPWGFETDTAGAFRFLREEAPALEASGFGVFLPGWWIQGGRRRSLSVRGRVKAAASESSGGAGMGTLLDVDWSMALGDREISLQELEDLARVKTPLVRFRGQWTELDSVALMNAADFMKKHAGRAVSAREIVKESLAGETGSHLSVSGLDLEGWVKDLVRNLKGEGIVDLLPAPKRLEATLRPYQVRGFSWLDYLARWGLGACLADDMGLGKTIQALSLVMRRFEGGEKQPVLLVCPTSVLNNWEREAARFAPGLKVHLHHGVSRLKGVTFIAAAAEAQMVLTGYPLLSRDRNFLSEVPWSGVILDEAQNIKNSETAQSKAVRSLRAGYRVALTGTPVENHVGDLWSVMDFLNPGFLGSRSDFRRHFFLPIQREGDLEAALRLKNLTAPFILRRLKTDPDIVPDLPEKQEMKVWCTLTREQASLYRAVLRELETSLEQAEGIGRKGFVLATLSRLKQVCNHPAHFLGDGSRLKGRSGKLARLTEMIEVLLENGDRALIFTQFREMGDLLRGHLSERFGREVLFLHGGVRRKKRDEMVRRFQEEDKAPSLFILSLRAGGTGLNLTRAAHVFHFDRWWNPAVEDQATDRAYRIGQTRDVQVHKFLCAGTLEERIDELIDHKRQVAGEVVGTGESWLTELSDDDLRELVALDVKAVKD